MDNPLSKIPPKYYGLIALAVGGVLAWRFLSPSNVESIEQSDNGVGYDAGLVALGVQTELERERMAHEAGLTKEKMAQEITLSSMSNATQLQAMGIAANTEISLAEKGNELARYQVDSGERITGARLAVENSIAAASFADAAQERAQAYNLANYQTMVQHDLGKKGIKANMTSGIVNTISSGVLKWFGKG